MKNLKMVVLFSIITISITFAQTSWKFDKSHSKVGFSVTHMVISETEGNFKEFEGKILTDEDNFENAKVNFSANINSIDTDNEDRDKHLKADDFFNAEKFPKLTFVSKSLKKIEGKEYKLIGDLTIKGITKQVELDVTFNGTIKDPWGNTRAGFNLEGEINRFDYGLKWNKVLETGGLMVGKDVTIIGKIELIKEK